MYKVKLAELLRENGSAEGLAGLKGSEGDTRLFVK